MASRLTPPGIAATAALSAVPVVRSKVRLTPPGIAATAASVDAVLRQTRRLTPPGIAATAALWRRRDKRRCPPHAPRNRGDCGETNRTWRKLGPPHAPRNRGDCGFATAQGDTWTASRPPESRRLRRPVPAAGLNAGCRLTPPESRRLRHIRGSGMRTRPASRPRNRGDCGISFTTPRSTGPPHAPRNRGDCGDGTVAPATIKVTASRPRNRGDCGVGAERSAPAPPHAPRNRGDCGVIQSRCHETNRLTPPGIAATAAQLPRNREWRRLTPPGIAATAAPLRSMQPR